jgi:transcriptional regulator with XRE-family HTH domain
MRRQEICLIKFILFDSIIIRVIIILTTYTTLTKVESGVVNKPSVQTMAKIAKALGVSIEDLIK